jgi:hypothetical protein
LGSSRFGVHASESGGAVTKAIGCGVVWLQSANHLESPSEQFSRDIEPKCFKPRLILVRASVEGN